MKNKNMEKMAQDHSAMKDWHENMAKSAANAMQDHIKAAAWHSSQSDLIKGMIEEVPLDPEKKVTSIPTASYTADASAPVPSSIGGIRVGKEEVPLDPDTVKKSDLIAILKEHATQIGNPDADVEAIANFLIK